MTKAGRDIDEKNRLWQKACTAYEKIDGESYPETKHLIGAFLVRDIANQDYMGLADDLMYADTGKNIPKIIGSLIVTIYEYEIKENENAWAMNNLGSLYYNGRTGEKNYELAMKYYSMSDKAGCALGTENIAYNYYYGLGTEIDYAMAHKYFTKAAILGRYEGMYKLGDMYRYGHYVDVEPKMVFECYTKALDLARCDQESANVCFGNVFYRIADAYYEGIGVEPSLEIAMSYYQRAELALYEQIKGGDRYHMDKIKYVVDKQKEIRERLIVELSLNREIPTEILKF